MNRIATTGKKRVSTRETCAEQFRVNGDDLVKKNAASIFAAISNF